MLASNPGTKAVSECTTSNLLEVRDLCVEYLSPQGPVRAVDHVSFDLAPGEVLGLAGESGSGKSTIAHALLRLLGPPAMITGGEVHYKGVDILAMNDLQLEKFRWSEVSMVFQSAMNALNPVLTVGDQIVDVIQAHDTDRSKRDARDRAGELFEIVGIDRGPSPIASEMSRSASTEPLSVR